MRSNKTMRVIFTAILFLTLFFQAGRTLAYAETEEDMWTKLGRGVGNILTGWVEVFYQPAQMSETKRWPIALAGGIPKGIFYAYMRTMVGVYETVTFFAPIPEGYRVILQPEFILAE